MLNKINNITNILDCGCGSGKVIKFLNKNVKYVGIDIDMDMIGKAINHYYNNNFMYCDLNSTNYPLILNNKFDTITCINTIMHFMNDNFWEKINSITNKNAKMLINLFDNIEFSNSDITEYYMEIKEDKLYYKFPIHNTIMEEKIIDKKCLDSFLLKYGWEIIEEYKPKTNNITKYYTWYILIKN
jgi:SAM-dependent methyltransferase